MLAADCGATHTRTAIFDLGLNVLAEQVSDISIAEGQRPYWIGCQNNSPIYCALPGCRRAG